MGVYRMNKIRNLDSTITNVNHKIINIINTKLSETNSTQQQLATATGIAQPTISKLLNGSSKFSLSQIIRISAALGENLFASVSNEDFDSTNVSDPYSIIPIEENDNLILSSNRRAFKGYLNNTYYTYFMSTVSGKNEVIHGELSFSQTQYNRCRVNFKLFTGKSDIANNPITKNYIGNMIISIPFSTCYCTLTNAELGELCFMSFHHMFFLNEQMQCRVAAVLTTSSGENRRPTLHRMIISQQEFHMDNPKDKQFLYGQLKLNNKKILIRESNLKCVLSNYKGFSEQMEKFIESNIQEQIIELDENQILGLNGSLKEKIDVICALRSESLANKNNKIGTNTDEFLFEYISKETKVNKKSL